MKKVTLVLMSDTHEQHRKISVPSGDVLIHAGDFTYFDRAARVTEDFNAWLDELPHKHKILVPGNHESRVDRHRWAERITAAAVLVNGGIEAEGLRIWGSPNCLKDWGAFGSSTADELAALYGQIPSGTDILITHAPPFGILDHAPGTASQGSRELLAAVSKVKPRLHVFGHIHQGHGRYCHDDGTVFINAALSGPGYTVTKEPISISLLF